MLLSAQLRIFEKGSHVEHMQFTTQQQQLTTCPQCDNVVRVDAEFCNICGKRLRPPTSTARSGGLPAISQAGDEEDDEYEEDEDEDGEITVEESIGIAHPGPTHT